MRSSELVQTRTQRVRLSSSGTLPSSFIVVPSATTNRLERQKSSRVNIVLLISMISDNSSDHSQYKLYNLNDAYKEL